MAEGKPTTGVSMSGGCLCGAVRFTAAPRDHDIGACHCNMCRRWTAGPFLALECGGTVKIDDASDLGIYRSSEWAERGFCKRCGTPLFYRLVGKDFYVVSAEAFDDKSGLSAHKPDLHRREARLLRFRKRHEKHDGPGSLRRFCHGTSRRWPGERLIGRNHG